MKRHRYAVVPAMVSLVLLAAGCSSSPKKSNAGSTTAPSASASASASAPSGKTTTITVGVLQDSTGPAASGGKTAVDGVKAGVVYAARNGIKVKYILGDSGTNPATTLAAAQKFVTVDHVDAIIVHSAVAFAATNYLTSKGIPVVGAAEDGPEWTKAANMFAVYGAIHPNKVADTTGKLFKMLGVTVGGALGYSISPSSADAAKSAMAAVKAVGLKVGYLNPQFPFGSTDVQPVALAMKSAGVDGITTATDPNTAFALITALRNAGANVKVAYLPTGYGGDLTQAGPGALQAAQNVYFQLLYEPVEMHTSATKQFESDLVAAGVTGEPTYAMYNGYTSVGLLVRGLSGNGGDTSHAGLIAGLSKIHDWDALGLWGGRTLDINDRTNIIGGVDACSWVTQLQGQTFKLVPGADPICGKSLNIEVASS